MTRQNGTLQWDAKRVRVDCCECPSGFPLLLLCGVNDCPDNYSGKLQRKARCIFLHTVPLPIQHPPQKPSIANLVLLEKRALWLTLAPPHPGLFPAGKWHGDDT